MRRLYFSLLFLTFAGCIPAGDSVEFQADGNPNNMNNVNNSNNVNNANNVNNSNNVNNTNNVSDASTPDSGVDMSSEVDMSEMTDDMSEMTDDMSPPQEMCTPQSEAELCMTAARECGAATVVDNCGATRDITCGNCATGATCEGGSCAENDCRDSIDNDGDGLENCADPDCNGRRCSQRPMDRCRGNGRCM